MPEPVVSMLIVRAMLDVGRTIGHELDPVLARHGICVARAAETGVVPHSVELELWNAARAGPPGFGLLVAERLTRGAFRALEYCVRCSRDLGEGIAQVVRFSGLLHGVGRFELVPGDPAHVRYDLDELPASDREQVEFDLASVVRMTRDACVDPWDPEAVWLAHPARDRDHERIAARVLGVSATFNQPQNALLVDHDDWAVPMREADAVLADILEDLVEREHEDLVPAGASVTLQVSAVLRACLARGRGSLGAVASELGTSERSLQRELQSANTSFRDILDATRARLAKQYLQSKSVTVTGVAAMLGYSDATTFYRAFKRWTGMSPSQYLESFD